MNQDFFGAPQVFLKTLAQRLETIASLVPEIMFRAADADATQTFRSLVDTLNAQFLTLRELCNIIPPKQFRLVGLTATLNLYKEYAAATPEGALPDLLRFYNEFSRLIWPYVEHFGHDRDLALFHGHLQNVLALGYWNLFLESLGTAELAVPWTSPGGSRPVSTKFIDPTRAQTAPLLIARLHWLMDHGFFDAREFERQLQKLRGVETGLKPVSGSDTTVEDSDSEIKIEDETGNRAIGVGQRIKERIYARMAREYHENIAPRLAEVSKHAGIAAESDMGLLMFKLLLERFGYPTFSENCPQGFEDGMKGKVAVHFRHANEDDLAEVEALHELGGAPLMTLKGKWYQDRYKDGRKRAWVEQAMVRGPEHYHQVKFSQPVPVDYGFDYYSDVPGPTSGWHQRLTVGKDLGHRILMHAGVGVPKAVWVCSPDPQHLDHFQKTLRTRYPLSEIICAAEHDHLDLLVLELWSMGFGRVAVKSDDSDNGTGVMIGDLNDPAFVERMKNFVSILLASGQSLLVQERIEPPYIVIGGVEHDWNLRVFITRDDDDQTIVAGISVRHSPKGGPVNLSLTAKTLTLEEVQTLLGLSAAEKAQMCATIQNTAIKQYHAVQAAIEGLVPAGTAGVLDWNGIDVILRREQDLFVPYIIEINGCNSGAMWNSGNRVGDMAHVTRPYARLMLRRGQAYRAKDGNEAEHWKAWVPADTARYYERLLAQYPDDARLLEYAYQFYSQGDLDDLDRGEVILRNLCVMEPFNPQYWNDLGAVLYYQKKSDAVGAYLTALAIVPGEAEVTVNLALAYIDEEKWDEIEKLLAPIVPNSEFYVKATLARVRAFALQHKHALQRQVIEDALIHHPDHPELLGAMIYVHMHQKNYTDAGINAVRLQIYQPKLVAPRLHQLFLRHLKDDEAVAGASGWNLALGIGETLEMRNSKRMALRYYHAGDFEHAATLYRLMLSWKPLDTDCWNNLAVAYMEQNKPDEAAAALTEALEKLPHEPLLHRQRAAVYAKQNDFESAILCYERVVELEPDNLQPYLQAAQIRFKQGRPDDVLQWLDRMIAHRPDDVAVVMSALLFIWDQRMLEALPTMVERVLALPLDPEQRAALEGIFTELGPLMKMTKTL